MLLFHSIDDVNVLISTRRRHDNKSRSWSRSSRVIGQKFGYTYDTHAWCSYDFHKNRYKQHAAPRRPYLEWPTKSVLTAQLHTRSVFIYFSNKSIHYTLCRCALRASVRNLNNTHLPWYTFLSFRYSRRTNVIVFGIGNAERIGEKRQTTPMHITAERIDYKQIWKNKRKLKSFPTVFLSSGAPFIRQFLSLIGTGTPIGSVLSLNVKRRPDGNTKWQNIINLFDRTLPIVYAEVVLGGRRVIRFIPYTYDLNCFRVEVVYI